MLVREISTSFDLIILFKLCFLFTMNAWLKTTRILNGSTLSIVSISLENRLTIRPRGVVSNISIAHRKLECKSAKCRTCEHWRPPNETVSDEKKVVPTEFSISMFGFSSFLFWVYVGIPIVGNFVIVFGGWIYVVLAEGDYKRHTQCN